MSESEFLFLYDQTLNQLEEWIDTQAPELDYEMSANIMTVFLPNQQKLIINRQTPLKQLWLATTKQGYHLNFVQNQWRCDKSQQTLEELLIDSIGQYCKQPPQFKLAISS